MKTRCLDPKAAGFKNYGGRGIPISPEWIDNFLAFQDYVDKNLGPRPKEHSIDRVDNDGPHRGYGARWRG
jgi:hypothetical protein